MAWWNLPPRISLLDGNHRKKHDDRTFKADPDENCIDQRNAHEDKYQPDKSEAFRNEFICKHNKNIVIIIVLQKRVQVFESFRSPIPLLTRAVVVDILCFSMEGVHYLI